MSFQALDGPSAHGSLTVTNAAVQEIKVGVSALEERKIITIQPSNKVYIYFGDGGAAPSAATVSANGFTLFKDALMSFEAATSQKVYVLAVTGSVDVKVAERA
jgi:hypothetical protein